MTKDTKEMTPLNDEKQPEVPEFDVKAAYAQLLAMQDQIREQAKAQGVTLIEPPPGDMITAVRHDSGRAIKPGEALNDEATTWRPWTKSDLDSDGEKHDFVPEFIAPIVHPLVDENRRARIFLTANDMTCALTVGVLNHNISGIFYWLYQNQKEAFEAGEKFKWEGPKDGPHIGGGIGGINGWQYTPIVTTPWIDIDGHLYQPGAAMPLMSEPE